MKTRQRSRLTKRKFRFWNRLISSIGSAAPRSCHTNPARAMTATAAPTRITGAVQPYTAPSERTKTNEARPTNTSPAPAVSNAPEAATRFDVGITLAPRRTAKIPIGTLIKKIHCQERYCVRSPPMSGPIAAPRPEQSMMTLIAFPVRSPGMNAVIMAAATDMSIAPPTAWNTLEITSAGKPRTMPGKNPQRSDPVVKTAKPVRKIFLYPYVSAIFPKMSTQPISTRRYDVATQTHGTCRDVKRCGDRRKCDVYNRSVKACHEDGKRDSEDEETRTFHAGIRCVHECVSLVKPDEGCGLDLTEK